VHKKLVEQIRENIKLKSTEQLLRIWKDNNREEYSDESFEVVKQLLLERAEVLPHQKEIKEMQDTQVKRFSRGGLIIAILSAISAIIGIAYLIFPLNSDADTLLTASLNIGVGIAMLIRSFRPPIGLGRALATIGGGSLAGVWIFELFVVDKFDWSLFIPSILLLGVGFKRSKQLRVNAGGSGSDKGQAGFCPKCGTKVLEIDENCPSCRINLAFAREHPDQL
jgi:hypothetical protein